MGQRGQGLVPGRGQGGEALDDDGEGILGREEEHRPGRGDRPVTGAGRAGGDGDREVEREEALAGLGRPAEDSGAAGEEEAVGQALPQGLELGRLEGGS
jgi:hypothetical protein